MSRYPRLVVTADQLAASRAQPGAFVAVDDPLYEAERAEALRRLVVRVGDLRRRPRGTP